MEVLAATLPVVATMRRTEEGRRWLSRLPSLVAELRERWSLRLGAPFHGGSCSWVAPAWSPGGRALVLKIGWPHREAAGEAEALRRWDGDGAVRLYRHDPERFALLLERCDPGVPLAEAEDVPAIERLRLGAGVLTRLWREPPGRTGLERLGEVAAGWADLVEERMDRLRPPVDPGLVARGADLLRELPAGAAREVILHGDFNPGNVLSARRGWLAIDAKPMIGDPAYDPWPLVEQVDSPFRHRDPHRVLAERVAAVAEVVAEEPRRLLAWAVARRVEMALWAAEHGDLPGAREVMHRVATLARLAGL